MTCLIFPLRSNSYGIAESLAHKTSFLNYSLPLFELQIGLILTICHLIRFFLKPIGISDFVCSMLAGIIIGPNVLGKYQFTREVIFPYDSQELIYVATNFGYYLFVFLNGVQIEIEMIFKTGYKALTIGIALTVMPFATSLLYNSLVKSGPFQITGSENFLVVVGIMTCLPVVAFVVEQLKLANTEVGRLALASALVADVGGIGIYIFQVFQWQRSMLAVVHSALPVAAFVLVLALVVRPALNWVIRKKPDEKSLSSSFINLLILFAFGMQVLFAFMKQTSIQAPFLIGLAIPAGIPLGSALVEKLGSFTNGVLMHILIVTSVMRVDLHLFVLNMANLKRSMIVISAFFIIKMLCCMIPMMFFKIPTNEALAIGIILTYTGVVQLYTTAIYKDNGYFDEQNYAFLIFYILLNSALVPVIVKRLFNPSRRYNSNHTRNCLSVKPRSELKILTCIYGEDNAEAYTKLLDTINPTKENPIGIYALHLVELIGRYVPILVTHSKLKTISTTTSQKIIYDFNQYEKNNWDSVSLQLFTSLSSFPLMHEDIINIAREKKTSLIILPLHRKWSVHGYIESQDKEWRNVNRHVLEKAPCSVAVFFSRGSNLQKRSADSFVSNMSVCTIFFGGNDDREALILAKRMFKESQVTLTVVQFLPIDNQEINESEDHMYDVVLIDEIRQMAMENGRLDYRPHVVEDGSETITMVRSMVKQYDMFIVGRRYGVSTPQLSGLSEWSEIPELGIMGDLFASKDLDTRSSVLVVQQQKKVRPLKN
ncbi:Cation/hydrogen exchanger family protein [Euphorbia peplus]|nr:Cation/hydrogen exchanger family protein [Euphorbia peplus]